MHHFDYIDGRLHCEGVPLREIARAVGTPCYVYSLATIRRHYRVFDEALQSGPHLICFSAKANSNGAVLRALARMGSGADIVSGGELYRALRAGVPADRIVFSGVGKTASEVEQALRAGILLFNVESAGELDRIAAVAKHLGVRAPVALRVNPDIDAQTHPYIATGLRESKFGIPLREAEREYSRAIAQPHLEVRGIDCHIGSQLTKIEPLVDSIGAVMDLARDLLARGVPLGFVDVGGGLGIQYRDEVPPSLAQYGEAMRGLMRRIEGSGLTLICEPGRVVMGNAGVLLTEVLYLKQHDTKRFVVVDAGMNDLLRPALYHAHHAIWPEQHTASSEEAPVDVVGPICESSDFLARDCVLGTQQQGDLLAVMSAGAYGFSMSSNYNSRPRAAEVLVDGARFAVVRQRESYEDLVRGETFPSWLEAEDA